MDRIRRIESLVPDRTEQAETEQGETESIQAEEETAEGRPQEETAASGEATPAQAGPGLFPSLAGLEREEETSAVQTGGAPSILSHLQGRTALIAGVGLAAVLLIGAAAAVWHKKKKADEERARKRSYARERRRALQAEEDAGAGRTQEMEKRAHGIYVGKTHNIGRRSSQQDSFGISDTSSRAVGAKGVLALIADGMGGLSKGEEISAMVTLSMMQYFDQNPMNGSVDAELLHMLNEANDKVNQYLGTSGRGKSGTTVVAVIIRDGNLHWISVGDSHIYLYREKALMQINRDHVYGAELDEKAARGEISYESAAGDVQRKALTSFVGMGALKKIDRNIRPLSLVDGDRILLCSDGVFGTLTDDEIILALQAPVEQCGPILDRMIREKNRDTQDNYTAVILEYCSGS